MCGICGMIYRDKDRAVAEADLKKMRDTMIYRGPDDAGVYIKENVGLASRRLSIIDLPGGHQPVHNEDKSIWIVYNGEIYNFKELYNRLLKKGHLFYTSTDTEVIVHLYEEYGDDCLKYLNGMFVFSIWDEKQKKLFIARDRLGEKPLYYYRSDDMLLFASELKGVIAHPEFKKEIDNRGLINYLQYSYIPDPLSIFKGVLKLPPGHSLVLRENVLKIRKYWELNFADNERKKSDDSTEELLAKFRESIRMRLISDVPLGAFLSGGIDSSAVVAVMSHVTSKPVKTFSIGFKEPAYNELPYARMVARRFNTEHHEEIIGPESVSLIEKLVHYFDEPFGDASCIPTYYLSRLASRHVKVALSGDGGDELFAGYDSYAVVMRRKKYELIPYPLRLGIRNLSRNLPGSFYGKNFLYDISLKTDDRFINYISYITDAKHGKLLSEDLSSALKNDTNVVEKYLKDAADLDPLSRMQYVDLKNYLPSDILVKVDRMSMANSLEVRVPLLDHTLVEFINNIPSRHKIRCGVQKHIFRQMAQKLLPREILERKKHGFSVPIEYWFKNELRDYLYQILLESRTIGRGYFDKKYLQAVVAEYMRGRRDHSALLWNLLLLEIWHRIYIDK